MRMKKTRTVTTNLRGIRKPLTWLAMLMVCALIQPLARADKKKAEKPYALIFGTAYGPDDRPLYGVKVTIRLQGKKGPSFNLVSDHRGEFAQRVHPGPADYLISGEAEYSALGDNGKPQISKKKRLKAETKVHIEGEERQDIGLHLTE